MPYPCSECSFIGVTERALRVHTQREHSGGAPKPEVIVSKTVEPETPRVVEPEKPDIASELSIPRTDEKLMPEVKPVALKEEPVTTERVANGTDLVPPKPDPFLVIRRRVYRELQRVESRRKYHPVNVFVLGPQGQGKCVDENTLIPVSDGRLIPISKWNGEDITELNSSLKLQTCLPLAFHDEGYQDCLQIVSRSGRQVTVTHEHPFLTDEGWQRADSLKTGDRVATPRTIPIFGSQAVPEHIVKVLAWLISEGGLTGKTPIFTNADSCITSDFRDAVEQFHNIKISLASSRGDRCPSWSVKTRQQYNYGLGDASTLERQIALYQNDHLSLTQIATLADIPRSTLAYRFKEAGVQLRSLKESQSLVRQVNPVTELLKGCGLMGQLSADKFVPQIIFTASKDKVALFLNRLYAGDGFPIQEPNPQIEYYTTSSRLAHDVQHLLLRFGILSQIKVRATKCEGETFKSYMVKISHAESVLKFIDEIGFFGKKDELARIKRRIESTIRNPNLDTIPGTFRNHIKQVRRDKKISIPHKLSKNLGIYRPDAIGLPRKRMLAIAKLLEDKYLADLASSDIYWDAIKSIKTAGKRHVYDLTMPNQNFLANDFIVHNTSLARQFAARTNSPLAEVQCGLLSEASQFFGQLKFSPGIGTYYETTQLVKAIETPNCVIILDELNRVDNPKVINSLFWLLDDRREAWLDDLQRYIRVAPGVVFFATLNEGVIFSGIDFVDAALRDRFTAIKMDYPSPEKEHDILVAKGRMEKVQQAAVNGFAPMAKTTVGDQDVVVLVNLANAIRENPNFDRKVSTRQLILAMEELSFGATMLEAIEFAFACHYESDLAEDIYKAPQLFMTEEQVKKRVKDPEMVF